MDTITTHQLKPCPFCGFEYPVFNQNRLDKEIICNKGSGGCGARVGWYVSILDLVRAWNSRVKRVSYENLKGGKENGIIQERKETGGNKNGKDTRESV